MKRFKSLFIAVILSLLVSPAFAEYNYFKGSTADEQVAVTKKVLTIGTEKRTLQVIPSVKETTALEVAPGIFRAEDIPAYTEDPETQVKTYNTGHLGESIEKVITEAGKGTALCVAELPKLLWATEEYDNGEIKDAKRQITMQKYIEGGKKAKIISDWVPTQLYSGEKVVVDQTKVQALIDTSAIKPVAVEAVVIPK